MADPVPSEYSAFYKKTTKRPKGIFLILFLLVLLLIGVFASLRFFSIDSFIASFSGTKTTPTPTQAPVVSPTNEPTSEPSPTISGPTGKSSGSPTPTDKKGTPIPTVSKSSVERSTLTVDVQNGSGEKGAARVIADDIAALGYKVGTVGNADAFDYTGVTIQVKSTKGNFLQQLKTDLSKDYTVKAATKDLPSTFTADALVIYGKDE